MKAEAKGRRRGSRGGDKGESVSGCGDGRRMRLTIGAVILTTVSLLTIRYRIETEFRGIRNPLFAVRFAGGTKNSISTHDSKFVEENT